MQKANWYTHGPALGLVIGKPIGILGATYLAVRFGLGRLPDGVNWSVALGLAMTAGIGFTVALFIAELSFDNAELSERAKVGVLAGSVISAVAGYALLRGASRPAAQLRINQSPGSPAGLSAHSRPA